MFRIEKQASQQQNQTVVTWTEVTVSGFPSKLVQWHQVFFFLWRNKAIPLKVGADWQSDVEMCLSKLTVTPTYVRWSLVELRQHHSQDDHQQADQGNLNRDKCNILYVDRVCSVNTVKPECHLHRKQWEEDIWRKPKLWRCVQIKENYNKESVVTLNLGREVRGQIRSGLLPLAIEVGRCKGFPEEQRELCDLDIVQLRKSLFEQVQAKNDDLTWISECDMLSCSRSKQRVWNTRCIL